VHIVGFIIRIYHDAARSAECQIFKKILIHKDKFLPSVRTKGVTN